jgi:hypothetical protein
MPFTEALALSFLRSSLADDGVYQLAGYGGPHAGGEQSARVARDFAGGSRGGCLRLPLRAAGHGHLGDLSQISIFEFFRCRKLLIFRQTIFRNEPQNGNLRQI